MSKAGVHEVEIIATSLDALKEALGVTGELSEGLETTLSNGAGLTVSEISKSSGFDATTVILTGIISIATSTSSAILIEWLKSRLFHKDSKPASPNITILIDGKKLEISGGS
jgi:hypothetical protein